MWRKAPGSTSGAVLRYEDDEDVAVCAIDVDRWGDRRASGTEDASIRLPGPQALPGMKAKSVHMVRHEVVSLAKSSMRL